MLEKFAKLYETHLGQILVKLDADEDDRPEVRVYFTHDGMGVCNIALKFAADDDGLKKADVAFESATEEWSIGFVKAALKQLFAQD